MKIIQITLILIISFISSSLAKEYIKDFDFKDVNYMQSKHDVKYFVKDGYKLVQQETRSAFERGRRNVRTVQTSSSSR